MRIGRRRRMRRVSNSKAFGRVVPSLDLSRRGPSNWPKLSVGLAIKDRSSRLSRFSADCQGWQEALSSIPLLKLAPGAFHDRMNVMQPRPGPENGSHTQCR